MSLKSYMKATSAHPRELVKVGEDGDIVSFAKQYLRHLDDKRTHISGEYRQLRYYANIFLVHIELDVIALSLPKIEEVRYPNGSSGSWLTGRYAGVDRARTYLNGCRRARYPSVEKEYYETRYRGDYLREIDGIRDFLKESKFLEKLTSGGTEQRSSKPEDRRRFTNTSSHTQERGREYVYTERPASRHWDGYTTPPGITPFSGRPSHSSQGGGYASFTVYDDDGIPTGQDFYGQKSYFNVQGSTHTHQVFESAPRTVEVEPPYYTTYVSKETGRHARGHSHGKRRKAVAGVLRYMS